MQSHSLELFFQYSLFMRGRQHSIPKFYFQEEFSLSANQRHSSNTEEYLKEVINPYVKNQQ